MLSFFRPKEDSVFAIHDINGIRVLTHLRLNFTHVFYHIFIHGFRDTIDPMSKCGNEADTTLHYFFRCSLYIYYLYTECYICY